MACHSLHQQDRLEALGRAAAAGDRIGLNLRRIAIEQCREFVRIGQEDRDRPALLLGRSDRFEKRDGGFHDRVAAAFRELAQAAPERIRLISAEGKPEEVTARLMAELSDLLP